MRILVITHSYYPKNDPRAFRWSAICECWAEKGISVDVVCSYAHANLPKREQIRGVNVFRVGDPSQKFSSFESPKTSLNGSEQVSLGTKIKQSLRNIIKKIVIMLRWPDYAWLWIPGAYREIARLLKTNDYDAIFSIAVPFSSHLPVMFLGRKRKNILWVCDYGDPFSCLKDLPMNNTKLYQYLNKWVESRVINASKKISVTTSETVKEYISYLGVNEAWLHVIPPLVKTESIRPEEYRKDINSGESIHLVFAGTLYAQIRNPKYLLELLSKVRTKLGTHQLMVHFYGKIGDCEQEFEPYRKAINDWIYLHGSVDKEKLRGIYQNADILINIGNATTYQVPSKVIEYMATGLPILNITSVKEDSSVLMLSSYPSSITLFQGDGISEKIIEELSEFIKNPRKVGREVVDEILKQYQPTTVANAYLNLLS